MDDNFSKGDRFIGNIQLDPFHMFDLYLFSLSVLPLLKVIRNIPIRMRLSSIKKLWICLVGLIMLAF